LSVCEGSTESGAVKLEVPPASEKGGCAAKRDIAHGAGLLQAPGQFFEQRLRLLRRITVAHRIDGQQVHRIRVERRSRAAGLAESDHQEARDQQHHQRPGDLPYYQQIAHAEEPVAAQLYPGAFFDRGRHVLFGRLK
jgi:hypothetical protein